ncbi:hypothetical protein V2J09_012029 [Rumex salicifolius]
MGLLVLVIGVACAGKIIAVMAVALESKIPVLNDEMFAIMVLMALVTTFMTTPIVMSIYKPAHRGPTPTRNRNLQETANSPDSLRVVACLHGPDDVPAFVSLIESLHNTTAKTKSKLRFYAMHLMELTERSSSIVMLRRFRRDRGRPRPWPDHGCAHELMTIRRHDARGCLPRGEGGGGDHNPPLS